MTCRRDCLPFGVPGKYFHKQKTLSCAKNKVARFLQPIITIKDNDGGGGFFEPYQCVHRSFLSTSSCNIYTVNALRECKLYVEPMQRGSNKRKRVWESR